MLWQKKEFPYENRNNGLFLSGHLYENAGRINNCKSKCENFVFEFKFLMLHMLLRSILIQR